MSNSFFNMFGLLKSPAYMLTWNAYVTPVTFCSLSEALKENVYTHKNLIIMQASPSEQMLVVSNPLVHDGLVMMSAFIQNGITPILPRRSQKWYPIQSLNTCLEMLENVDDREKHEKNVLKDLFTKHGISSAEQLAKAREYVSWIDKKEDTTTNLFDAETPLGHPDRGIENYPERSKFKCPDCGAVFSRAGNDSIARCPRCESYASRLTSNQ